MHKFLVFCFAVVLLLTTKMAPAQGQTGTAFTYQGLLTQSEVPANGQFCFVFKLFNAQTGGSQIGPDLSPCNVQVSDGQFSLDLDFGPGAFVGEERWLQIQVVTDGGLVTTTLQPRQRVSPAPEAVYAEKAGSVDLATEAETAWNGIPSGAAIITKSAIAPPHFTATGETIVTQGSDTAWAEKSLYPGSNISSFAADLNGELYVFGGGKVYRYNEASNTWAQRTTMSNNRVEFAAAVMNGKVYITGGRAAATGLTTTEVYDPVTNTWSSRAPLPKPLMGSSYATAGGFFYVFGGRVAGESNTTTFRYNPATNTWGTVADSPAFYLSPAAGVDDRIYVFGGPGASADRIYEFDPSTFKWTSSVSIPGELLVERAVAVVGKKIHVLGGSIFSMTRDIHLIYDPQTFSWSRGQRLPGSRSDGTAAAVGEALYYLGGVSDSISSFQTFRMEPGKATQWHVHTKD